MRIVAVLGCVLAVSVADFAHGEETWKSHRPLRVAPAASNRALPAGPMLVIDAENGNDGNAGTQAAPLRTVQVAINRATPGTTVTLRGGVYFERLVIAARGTAEKPFTLRSWPGETAVIDGSWSEFSQSPDKSWQPIGDGAAVNFGQRRNIRTCARRSVRSAIR